MINYSLKYINSIISQFRHDLGNTYCCSNINDTKFSITNSQIKFQIILGYILDTINFYDLNFDVYFISSLNNNQTTLFNKISRDNLTQRV